MNADIIFQFLYQYTGLSYVCAVRFEDFIIMIVSMLFGYGLSILNSAKGRVGTYQTEELKKVAAIMKDGKLMLRSPRNIQEGVVNVLIVMFKGYLFRKGRVFQVHSEVRARRTFIIVFTIVIILLILSLIDNWHVTLKPPK